MEKMDADELDEDVDESTDVQSTQSVEGDALEYDESAYIMYHRAQTGELTKSVLPNVSCLHE